jgi:hypothetical protein
MLRCVNGGVMNIKPGNQTTGQVIRPSRCSLY